MGWNMHGNHLRLVLLTVLLVALLVSALIVQSADEEGFRLTHNKRSTITATPADSRMPEYYEINIQASDGIHISGWLIPPDDKKNPNSTATVIIAHGLSGNRASFLRNAEFIHDAGYTVIVFDFRAHGISDGEVTSIGLIESQDILGIIGFIKNNKTLDSRRIVAYGFSMGAVAAIIATSTCTDIRGVISDSAYADLKSLLANIISQSVLPPSIWNPLVENSVGNYAGINVRDNSAETYIQAISPRPVLLIQGGADSTVNPGDVERLFYNAGEPKQKLIMPSAEHVHSYDVNPSLYKSTVLDFLETSIPL